MESDPTIIGRMRMKQTIKVHFFGKFSIEKDTVKLDEQTIHSKKVIKLLAYFLINSNRMISGEELGELLWGNGGSANPMGALKNLVYRLRNILKELGPEEYILSRSGTYGWNPEIEVLSDMAEFKSYAEQTRDTQDDTSQKIQKYERAIVCYRKPETSSLTSESWLAVRFTYYHSVYMKLLLELCELYSTVGEYEKIQKICGYALTCDELNEEVHYWLIKSWVELGKIDHALKQYDTAVKILYEKLGIGRSLKMQTLYEEILCMSTNWGHASMEDVCEDIQEEEPQGAFFCEYTVFREIYRLEVRRVLRSGIAEYILLLTLEIADQENVRDVLRIQYLKKRGMRVLQRVLAKHLRMGDVVARYGDEQYVVMLPYCDYENAQKVFRRIMTNFNRDMHDRKVVIKAETREISMNYDLPSARKGGVRWTDDKEK